LKHEVPGETLQVSSDLLDQALRLNAVGICQFFVEHHLTARTTKIPYLNLSRYGS
jgi:hypothetical protein